MNALPRNDMPADAFLAKDSSQGKAILETSTKRSAKNAKRLAGADWMMRSRRYSASVFSSWSVAVPGNPAGAGGNSGSQLPSLPPTTACPSSPRTTLPPFL